MDGGGASHVLKPNGVLTAELIKIFTRAFYRQLRGAGTWHRRLSYDNTVVFLAAQIVNK